MKNFTILGERCSGTNFLQLAIERNFDLEATWKYGWKHFFGFDSYSDSDDCLFISIVRDPLDWINSFFNSPHHVYGAIRGDVYRFLDSQMFSVFDSGSTQGQDMPKSHHIHENRRYRDVFELRNVKANFQMKIMPTLVKNHVFIRYEDLRDNYEHTLTEIADTFHLQKLHNPFQKITQYKMTDKIYPQPSGKTYTLIDIINRVDQNLEKEIGYTFNLE